LQHVKNEIRVATTSHRNASMVQVKGWLDSFLCIFIFII